MEYCIIRPQTNQFFSQSQTITLRFNFKPGSMNWVALSENSPSDMCNQQRLCSDCASAKSEQSLCWLHGIYIGPVLFILYTVKPLLRPHGWAGSTESLHIMYVHRNAFLTTWSKSFLSFLIQNHSDANKIRSNTVWFCT